PSITRVEPNRALTGPAGVRKRLGPSVDYSERTRDNTVAAAIANVVLHENRAGFGANNRSRRTRFEAAGFFAMLADIGKKNPAKRVVVRQTLLSAPQSGLLFKARR